MHPREACKREGLTRAGHRHVEHPSPMSTAQAIVASSAALLNSDTCLLLLRCIQPAPSRQINGIAQLV